MHQPPRQPAVPFLLALACLFLFLSAYPLVHLPDLPGKEIGSYLFNALIAAPALLALARQLGTGRALTALAAVTLFAYLIEGIGTATGFPYGPFHYGEALGPLMFDLVPYLLPFSYVPLVIGCVAAVAALRSGVLRVLAAAVLLVAVDGVLDPGAALMGFWVWPEGGPYYGVPLSNYGGWLLSGIISSGLLTWIAGARLQPVPARPGLLDSLILSLSLWLGVAVFSGLLVPAILAVVLGGFLLRRRYLLSRERQVESLHAAARAGA